MGIIGVGSGPRRLTPRHPPIVVTTPPGYNHLLIMKVKAGSSQHHLFNVLHDRSPFLNVRQHCQKSHKNIQHCSHVDSILVISEME